MGTPRHGSGGGRRRRPMRRPCVRRLPPAAPAPSGSSGSDESLRTLATRFVSADPESVDAWTADLRSLQADTTDGEIVSVRCDITDRTRRRGRSAPATVPTRTTSLPSAPAPVTSRRSPRAPRRCATVRRVVTPSPPGAGRRTAPGPETAPWITRHLQRARASWTRPTRRRTARPTRRPPTTARRPVPRSAGRAATRTAAPDRLDRRGARGKGNGCLTCSIFDVPRCLGPSRIG